MAKVSFKKPIKSVWARLRRLRKKDFVSIAAFAALAAVVFWFCCPPPLEESRRYPSGLILRDRDGGLLRVGLGLNDQDCRPYYRASRRDWVVLAAIAAEDRNYYNHCGVDFMAILRSAKMNILNGRVLSGASTITMQTVRLIHPRRRTYWSKAVEAVQSMRLERCMDKDEIMTQYLNRAPFGSNLVGIEAASWGWFGKPPQELNMGEAALLAGLLQSPTRFRPDRYLDRALKRRKYVLDRMLSLGMVDEAAVKRAEQLPLNLKRAPRPFSEPFFCDWAVSVRKERSGDMRTSLDRALQVSVNECLRRYAQEFGIDYAAVVLRVDSGQAVVMSCTGDYFSNRAGQVNTAVSPRPAGSTLKPFVFAMALDSGFINPETMLSDVPQAFGNREPQNFSGKFLGPVSARYALVQSLNLPAIQLERMAGQISFYNTLKRLRLQSLNRPAGDYGLGLVLGNGSVTLLELCNAYAAIARGGEWRPCTAFLTPVSDPPERIFSAAACWLVSDMLGGDERAMSAIGHAGEVEVPRFAWKTGTSAGYRDAWTVAWNPEYVVGVWCGMKHGARVPNRLVGIKSAAPAVWEIVRRLYPSGTGPWFRRPEEIEELEVCAKSGAVPGEACPSRVKTFAIRGCTNRRMCTLHERAADGRTVLKWPEDLAAFFRSQEAAATSGATAAAAVREPRFRITAPSNGTVVKLLDGINQQVTVKLGGVAPDVRVWWFCDNVPVAEGVAGDGFSWPPEAGRHTISCSTADGRDASVKITVEE
ncbi:MAG: penicillin-binding protein 1C [Kiritimatiellae bacterium]|nr:penicillin-binding protein 1C [Kiritimatiellia bacterium]